MVTRVKTGIPGLDKLLEGGIPKGAVLLISGTPGTGKSILSSQMAYQIALSGKKCLYLNLEQKEGQIEIQMEQFGWDAKKVKNKLKIVTVDSSNPKIVEYVIDEIKNANYDLIILDSLDSISSSPVSLEELGERSLEKVAEFTVPTIMDSVMIGRMKLKRIFKAINTSNATAILTSEKVEGAKGISRDTISEFLCDGIIILHSVEGEEGFRTLNIPKMRLTKQKQGIYSFTIEKEGVKVKAQEG
ncbi:MAG: ATPase domain-containing protein [Candidatus Diapherotrites archaeon]